MKMQTSITFEELHKRLGFVAGLKIAHVEALPISGILRIVVEGDPPPRTVTSAGFYPSSKHAGAEPDSIHINYFTKKE